MDTASNAPAPSGGPPPVARGCAPTTTRTRPCTPFPAACARPTCWPTATRDCWWPTLRNGGRLRLFRGGRQQQQAEQALAALPCGLAAFRTESAPAGQPPSVAVAAGSCLYVYRNLRPFYKFSLPHTAADEQEKEAWSKHQDPDALREALEALRSQGGMGRLTARSQRFLLLEPEEATAFIEANWEFPLKRQTQVTALGVLKKSLADEDAATCLLLATEDGRLFVLEPDAFTLLAAVQVPGAVCCLDAQGAFDVDFHVALATRDDRLHVVKRGHKASRVLAEPGGACRRAVPPGARPVGGRVRRQTPARLLAQVTAFARRSPTLTTAIVVVRVFAADGAPTHALNTRDAVSAIHFGRLGREDNALVTVGTGGSLTVLILRRNAQLLQSPSSRETTRR
ncbi:hypothetical protein MRX96_033668 [Rhipicephalus microplus]